MALLATLLVFAGVWWIRRTNIRGQYAMVLAQVCWGIHALCAGQTMLAVQSGVLLLLTLDAVRVWRKQGVRPV